MAVLRSSKRSDGTRGTSPSVPSRAYPSLVRQRENFTFFEVSEQVIIGSERVMIETEGEWMALIYHQLVIDIHVFGIIRYTDGFGERTFVTAFCRRRDVRSDRYTAIDNSDYEYTN